MGCGDAGMEAAEQVIRAGLLKLGATATARIIQS
jgi:hypothetical protein